MVKPDKRIGGVVMGYCIEERIGWGGTSKVYRGRHHLTSQLVAIKIMNKPRSRIGYAPALTTRTATHSHSHASDLQRTYSECTTLEKLKHPNIVEMYQWFETEKHIYIVMELARNGAAHYHIVPCECVRARACGVSVCVGLTPNRRPA